jgi:hypothetical protein
MDWDGSNVHHKLQQQSRSSSGLVAHDEQHWLKAKVLPVIANHSSCCLNLQGLWRFSFMAVFNYDFPDGHGFSRKKVKKSKIK